MFFTKGAQRSALAFFANHAQLLVLATWGKRKAPTRGATRELLVGRMRQHILDDAREVGGNFEFHILRG